MAEAIVTDGLTKRYGKLLALDHLTMEVHEGEVFGFLGPNGAGKTTTIRLLLDVLRPTSGTATVLGFEPRSGGPELRHRIGYLPGDYVVDGRQTPSQYLTYLGNLRGGVPAQTVVALANRLELNLDLHIGSLSKGNRQKVGLVQAFMHEPELLILDEPTSGLDPLVARTFLEMVEEAKGNGQTVFMSSHILSEVQHVADRAAIIRHGKLVAVDEVEDLRARAIRRVHITFNQDIDAAAFEHVEGVSDVEIGERELRCRLSGAADSLIKVAAQHDVVDFISEEPDLEELFFHYYEGDDDAA